MPKHKLKMVKNKQGQSVPFFAADGKGKMARGGRVKKAMGGNAMKKRVMKRGGGMMKKPMMKRGGKVKK